MNKNILIIGAARSGKTTLSRKISKEYGYSIISLDDIICAFESIPSCGIKHDADDVEVSKNFSGFLKSYLKELSEGPNFYNGSRFVIEGTHIDFESVIPYIYNNLKDKYEIIGLTYDYLNEEKMYKNIKKYDTEDDWTYYNTDEELKGNIRYFIKRNKFFHNEFLKYDIKTYDVSFDRESALISVCEDLFDNKKIK